MPAKNKSVSDVSEKKKYVCPECRKAVGAGSVGCCVCDVYYHAACLKITKEQLSFLHKNKNFLFKCMKCMSRGISVVADHSAGAKEDMVEQNCSQYSGSKTMIIDAEISKCCTELSATLERKQDEYKTALQKEVKDFKNKMEEIVSSFCAQYDAKLRKLEDDLKNYYSVAQHMDKNRSTVIQDLELHNDILQRRLNRADIVVSGLPDKIKDLRGLVIKIASLCRVNLDPRDIQHCCYIFSGKSVLVKLNSVYARDLIMANYYKGSPLLLSSIIDEEVRSYVYLNDHLNVTASKLVYICKKLRGLKKIQQFKIINADRPRVEIKMPSGSIKILDLDKCVELLDESSQGGGSNNYDY